MQQKENTKYVIRAWCPTANNYPTRYMPYRTGRGGNTPEVYITNMLKYYTVVSNELCA